MNSFERMENRLIGIAVDKVPNFNIYMTFAAKFINQPLSKYYLDYKTLVDANMAMVENFDADIVQAISDPYREAYDFGAKIEFPEDNLPKSKIPLLETPEKLKSLKRPNPSTGKRMSDRLEAIRLMKEKVGGELPVMGWIEGALAEAGDLRGMSTIMMDLFERPDWVKELLEFITDVEIDFAIAQIKAGADIIGLGDAICSQISPEMYSEFALPYERKIFEAIKLNGAIPRLHICGDTTAILPNMVTSGARIIDLDWMVDILKADKDYGKNISFCGNMDPVAIFLEGTENNVFDSTINSMQRGSDRLFSAAGCEIPLGTPPKNLHTQNIALIEIARL